MSSISGFMSGILTLGCTDERYNVKTKMDISRPKLDGEMTTKFMASL